MHLCPLNDNEPSKHSYTERSISASEHTIAGFLASRPSTHLKRWGCGCITRIWSATFDVPINAKTLIFPVFIIGSIIYDPDPNIELTTPGGVVLWNASITCLNSKHPCFGGLKTTVLPIISAGMSVVNVSFNG